MNITRLTYYIDPKRESVAGRIREKIDSLVSEFGAEIADTEIHADEVRMVIQGLETGTKDLFKEMVNELLDQFGTATTVGQLQESARRLIRKFMEDPAYQFSPGVIRTDKVAAAVAEELGHDEWLNDDNHWVFRLTNELAP